MLNMVLLRKAFLFNNICAKLDTTKTTRNSRDDHPHLQVLASGSNTSIVFKYVVPSNPPTAINCPLTTARPTYSTDKGESSVIQHMKHDKSISVTLLACNYVCHFQLMKSIKLLAITFNSEILCLLEQNDS